MTTFFSVVTKTVLEILGWCLIGGMISLGNPARIADSIPLGRERETTVPTFNAWTLGWNATSLSHGLGDYWNAPIFFPLRGTFTYSEAQPTMLLVSPLAGVARSHALAYNVYLMLLLGLNAWMTRRLLLKTGSSVSVTWCCGFLMLMLPFVHQQLGVIQLVAVCGPLSVIWRVLCWNEKPDWKNSLWLGLSFFLTYSACNYYGLFLSLLAPVFLILIWPRLWSWRNCRNLCLAAACALVLVLPIVSAQMTWLQKEVEPRSLEMIQGLSTTPLGYLAPYWSRWKTFEFSSLVHVPKTLHVGTGSILTTLAAVGGIAGLTNRKHQCWTAFLVSLAVVSGVLSCGPHARWGNLIPYEGLLQWYPGLNLIRSPFRFAVIVQITQVLLLAEVLRWTEDRLQTRRHSALFLILLTTLLAAAQSWPLPPRLHRLPNVTQNLGWINWLKNHSQPHEGIVCLPFPRERTPAGYQQTVDWMYLNLWHERAMLNGYSGFFPNHFRRAKVFMQTFPERDSVTQLREWGVHYVVAPRADSRQLAKKTFPLPLLYEDPVSKVRIYSLHEEEKTLTRNSISQ